MAIQQELQPQVPVPASPADDDLDDLYEEEPRRRSWGAIAAVVLALGLVFVGYQWNQAVGRERLLGSQVSALRADAESLRLRAEEAQRMADGLQKRMATAAAERDALADRLAALEKSARAAGREKATAAAAKEPLRPKATPVAARAVSTTKKAR